MQKTPKAPPDSKAAPQSESRRQLPLFVELSYPRRRPMYDCSVLLQALFEVRSRHRNPKPLAKARENIPLQDDQLDLNLELVDLDALRALDSDRLSPEADRASSR